MNVFQKQLLENSQIIINIAMMREKITGAKTDFNNTDLNDKNYYELEKLQSDLMPYYNDAVKNN